MAQDCTFAELARINLKWFDLAVVALIKVTANRPGAIARDRFDPLNAFWRGRTIFPLRCLEFHFDGVYVEYISDEDGDGEVRPDEPRALSCESVVQRVKRAYFETKEVGHGVTPDEADCPRRAANLLAAFLLRCGRFNAVYEGMSEGDMRSAQKLAREWPGCFRKTNFLAQFFSDFQFFILILILIFCSRWPDVAAWRHWRS